MTSEEIAEEKWTRVANRRNSRQKRQQQTMTGTGTEVDEIKAETKRAWLHVGRLKQETTTDAVKRFLAKKGIFENVICEESDLKYRTKAFKVGIPFNFLKIANEAYFWPAGVTVRHYRFFRSAAGGIDRIKQSQWTTEKAKK